MNPFDKFDEEAERTMHMLGNIKRVQANPYTADKVLRRIAAERSGRADLTPRAVRFALAGLFVLIIVNVFSLVEIRAKASARSPQYSAIQDFSTEYSLTITGYQY
jgi:hypothetical protein